jgi:predicted PurR-regulated permease PerM
MADSKVEGHAAVAAVTSGRTRPVSSSAGDVTVRFDPRSVRRSGVILLALVAAFLLALWLFSVTRHFLFLVLLGWMFAIALEPGIKWLIAHGRSRGVAAAIMGGGVILVSLVLAAVFGKLFFTQISAFVANIPSVEASLIHWVNARFGTHLDVASIASSLHLSSSDVGTWAGKLSGGLLGVVGSLSAVLFDLITVIVFGFYIAGGGPGFMRTLATGMPPHAQRVFVNVAEITIDKTGGYVVSKIILAALSSLFHGIFFLAIGVPYWLPFALLVGITAQFVPLIGTYIGVALPVLATVFGSPWRAIAIIVFAIVYQQIESYVFTPRVSQKTMDVNPAIALAAVFLGVAVWGPIGAIIGIPLVAAGASILDAYTKSYDLVPEVVDMVDEEPGETDTPEAVGSTAPEDEDAGG